MTKVTIDRIGFFVNPSGEDNAKFWARVSQKKWELQTFRLFERFLDKHHSYIDVGAWIGPTVLYGAQLARHCYAIEPDPQAFSELEANIRLNPSVATKVSLFNTLIGDTCGEVAFGSNSQFGDSMSSMIFSDPAVKVMAKATTLEELISTNNITDCNFIKMDIEGGEVIVLPNIENYLRNHKPILLLSLHPQLFPNKNRDAAGITSVLRSAYKYFYSDVGHSLSIKELQKKLRGAKGFSIVASCTPWPLSERGLHFIERVFFFLLKKLDKPKHE